MERSQQKYKVKTVLPGHIGRTADHLLTFFSFTPLSFSWALSKLRLLMQSCQFLLKSHGSIILYGNRILLSCLESLCKDFPWDETEPLTSKEIKIITQMYYTLEFTLKGNNSCTYIYFSILDGGKWLLIWSQTISFLQIST